MRPAVQTRKRTILALILVLGLSFGAPFGWGARADDLADAPADGSNTGSATDTRNTNSPASPATAPDESPPGETAPSGEPQGLDTDFLLLPAYDLNRQAGPGPGAVDAASEAAPASGARVGDRITLKVTGFKPPAGADSIGVELPRGSSPLLDQGWQLLPSSPAKAGAGGGNGTGSESELTLTVVPLKSGQTTLPSLAIIDKPSGKAIARTNPWTLQVESAIRKDDPKPQEPAAPQPPADLLFPWWVIVAGSILGLLLLAGLGYGAYRVIRARRSRAGPAPAPRPRKPAEEEALAALSTLEGSDLLRRAEFKAYYHRVSEILKIYLGRRYQFAATESTTRELLDELSRLAVGEAIRRTLDGIYMELDLVKFTDHRPTAEEARYIVERARKIVQLARPAPLLTEEHSGTRHAGSASKSGPDRENDGPELGFTKPRPGGS